MNGRIRKTLLLSAATLTVACGGMGAHAATAAASTVQVDGSSITYDAAPGEANRLTVTLSEAIEFDHGSGAPHQ